MDIKALQVCNMCSIIYNLWCLGCNNKNKKHDLIKFFDEYEYTQIWNDKKGQIQIKIYSVKKKGMQIQIYLG